MASHALATVSQLDEEFIDRDRIVNGDLVPDEYFCSICQFLLWKPHSCSSCQQLFCEKCIRIWLTNGNIHQTCPFRCQPYVNRPCPPSVQSLLSHLKIRCRNASLGCTQILSYDQLEYHENTECQYLTQKCIECHQFVLISKVREHQQTMGLCIPRPVKCIICQNDIPKVDFRDHFNTCRQRRIEVLNIIRSLDRNMQRLFNNQPIVNNDALPFHEQIAINIQLIQEQKRTSRFLPSLKGIDRVERVREQNCSHLYHILIMLEFFILNWSKFPYFMYITVSISLHAVFMIVSNIYSIFSVWIKRNFVCTSSFLMLLTYILTYGCFILVQSVSDSMLILCLTIVCFFLGCLARIPLETYELDLTRNRPILNILICCLGLFGFKIILLFIRWYNSLIPVYWSMNFIFLFNLYLIFRIFGAHTSTDQTTTDPVTTPL